MTRMIISILSLLLIVSGCTTPKRQMAPVTTAAYPFVLFLDPVTEEVPHVKIDR